MVDSSTTQKLNSLPHSALTSQLIEGSAPLGRFRVDLTNY
ncbi:hypothetical protein VP150E351_P0067 [Vibrio phage 150E35-1]|nr:hypothetical protein VP150E351_P0067 [Vibrio phage 150E35-1]